ncbi:MAG TPA: hypothetical protein HPP80_00425 [Rhodospirillaceae bacterium]|nr:hypothetical protein [Rhodospirillaceae bacterium]
MVHSADQAKAALTAALDSDIDVVLVSPPFGAQSLGIAYFQAMLTLARQSVPDAKATAMLDCGDAPGLALAALFAGVEMVRLSADQDMLERLDQIARSLPGKIVDQRPHNILDLAGHANPLMAARHWLNQTGSQE